VNNEVGGRPITVFVSPISVRCVNCNASIGIFDSKTDGYYPEIGDRSATLRGNGVPTKFECTCAGGSAFSEVTARFEHSSECFDVNEEKIRAGKLQAENLFSWFTLVGQCFRCGQLQQLADFECC
jgi:hypothetical protein